MSLKFKRDCVENVNLEEYLTENYKIKDMVDMFVTCLA